MRPPRRLLLLAAAVGLLLAAPVPAAQVEGIRFVDSLVAKGRTLRLQGLGLLRYRVIFRGYVAALYVEEGVEVPSVLDEVSRRLEIEYFWGIPAAAFADATIEGITRNVDPAALAELEDQIAEFNRLYRDVAPGDRYALTYVPGQGTDLTLNGEVLGSVGGSEFSAAIFSIWLGRAPLDTDLKQALLGQRS